MLEADLAPGALSPRDITLTTAGALVTDPGIGRGRTGEELIEVDAVQYLSPEEARGEPPRPQSAVYSLACVLHECLTGECPYPRDLPQAVLYAHVAEPPPRPSQRNAALPSEVDTVFERAMAPALDKRQATPGEFARELAAALGTVEVEPKSGTDLVRIAGRRSRPGPARRARQPALLVAAAAACAVAGFALGSGGETDEAPEPRAIPGPPAAAVAAERVVDQLEGRRARLRERLAAARTRAGQDRVALLLARLHGRVARDAGEAGPDVRGALADARRAYELLAADAGTERALRRGWATGRAAVARADVALRRALARAGR